jgi:hypothetical protein
LLSSRYSIIELSDYHLITLLLWEMTGNRIITKLTALLLMLVFSQKMGMSLYLHNWLHAAKQHSATPTPFSGQEIQFACGCIDHFSLPLTETAVPELRVPVTMVHHSFAEPVFSVQAVSRYFHSLRAPPVVA